MIVDERPPVVRAVETPAPVQEPADHGLADTLRVIARLLVELDEQEAALSGDLEDRRVRALRERAAGEIGRLRAIARMQARQETGFASVLAQAFAAALAGLAAGAQGRLQALIHPELGLFVVHNVAGSQPRVDRVTRWPRHDHDYSTRLDEGPLLRALAGAAGWRSPLISLADRDCPRVGDGLSLAHDTVFDAWAVIFAPEFDVVPDRHRLEPWARLRERYAATRDDLGRGEYEDMQRAALVVSHSAHVSGLRLDFGRIAGRWYLLGVQMLDEACG